MLKQIDALLQGTDGAGEIDYDGQSYEQQDKDHTLRGVSAFWAISC